MTISFLEAVDAYGAAASASFSGTCAEDPKVEAFSKAVTKFVRLLGEDADDEYWAPILRRLLRVRWDLATTPLPINHEAIGVEESSEFVSEALRGCSRMYPQYAGFANEIVRKLDELATVGNDPLGETIKPLLSSGAVARDGGDASIAIVLRRSRNASAVEDYFTSMGLPATVKAAAELAQITVYDRVILVGALSWYPASILTAPRAFEVYVVQYGWIRSNAPSTSLFTGSTDRTPSLPIFERPSGAGASQGNSQEDAEELRPPTDWAAIGVEPPRGEAGPPEPTEAVPAYLFLLASDEAVYLEAEEGSRAYVVTLGAEKELGQVPTDSIAPGAYLVTRQGGEGDYIPAIANSLLGERAQELRTEQLRWKGLLQALIERVGIQNVVRRLEKAGSLRATDMNARRWASSSAIRTRDYRDFEAIMKVIGLETQSEDLWTKMGLLDKAHLRAGMQVRDLLEREIVAADTRQLERRGWMDYDVAEIEGEGALRVARIEERAPDFVLVAPRRTRRPFQVERDLWHG